MSTTPEELSKSYDEHLRIFEQALDSGKTPPSVRGGPSAGGQKSKPRSISKASGSPTRDRSGSASGRSMSPAHGRASAVRANSNPGEVIIGFAPSERASSPEETTLSRSQERTLGLSRSSGGSVEVVKLVQPQAASVSSTVPAPAVAATATAVASSSSSSSSSSAAASKSGSGKPPASGKASDPRGPKVDVKSLSKAERRELAQKEQELAKARKQQHQGGAKAEKGGANAPSASSKAKDASGAAMAAPAGAIAAGAGSTAHSGNTTSSGSVPKSGGSSAPKSHANIPSLSSAGSGAVGGTVGASSAAVKLNRVPFFMHLPEHASSVPAVKDGSVHPAIVRLGAKYVDGSIMGSSARCVALVEASKDLVADFKLPAKSEFSKHFSEYLRPNINFVVDCRPKSVSMGNFIRALKNKITENRGKSEAEGKANLQMFLDEFLDERFLTAQSLIVDNGVKKIVDGDVIMTFACSYVVSRLLIAAHEGGKRFRVVVVDSSPLMEGKEFLKRMVNAGISCTYVLLNAVCYMMKSVTKVLVGAYALLSNGNLVSRVGTAAVCMAAHEWSVPVIVCSETIKFSEKTLLDSITWNELGNADDLAASELGRKVNVLSNWKDIPQVTLLSVLYDVTPMEFITMVITEFGNIPPTSVPVILREEYGNKKDQK